MQGFLFVFMHIKVDDIREHIYPSAAAAAAALLC